MSGHGLRKQHRVRTLPTGTRALELAGPLVNDTERQTVWNAGPGGGGGGVCFLRYRPRPMEGVAGVVSRHPLMASLLGTRGECLPGARPARYL